MNCGRGTQHPPSHNEARHQMFERDLGKPKKQEFVGPVKNPIANTQNEYFLVWV